MVKLTNVAPLVTLLTEIDPCVVRYEISHFICCKSAKRLFHLLQEILQVLEQEKFASAEQEKGFAADMAAKSAQMKKVN